MGADMSTKNRAFDDVPVRPAATVCALRSGPKGLEVLMVRRAAESAFMGNAYVFPGGRVDAVDRSDLARRAVHASDAADLSWKAAALRELVEETGVWITIPRLSEPMPGPGELDGGDVYLRALASSFRFDGDALAYLSNWVTPQGSPRRFDTRFYVVEVKSSDPAAYDGREVTDAAWTTPAEALRRGDGGGWLIRFPTRHHLHRLAAFATPDEAVREAAAQTDVTAVSPRPRRRHGTVEWVIPGEPGYEDLPG